MAIMGSILKRIIHNDAMKEDPHEIYNWRVYALAFAVSSNPFHLVGAGNRLMSPRESY